MLHIINSVIRVKIGIRSKIIYIKDRFICHDAEDPKNIVYLGESNSSYKLLNSRVIESDLVIYVKYNVYRI